MRIQIGLFAILAAVVGCISVQPHAEPMAIAIVEYDNPDAAKVVCLPHDYGFLVEWDKDKQPEFYVYDKKSRWATCTPDFSEFLKLLEKIPSGATVDRIEKCCAPFSWGMPNESRNKLAALLKRKSFRMAEWEDGNFGICTCESKEIRLLKGKR